MQLQDVIKRIVEVEETIAVSDDMKVARAYPYLPRGGDALDLPCFFNQRRFIRQQLSGGMRRRWYEYRLQLLIAKANVDPAEYAELADAFEDATLAAFAAQVKLGEPSIFQQVRGEEGLFQPLVVPWNDVDHYVLQFLLDVEIGDTVLTAAGG